MPRASFTTLAELRCSIGGLGVAISAAPSLAADELESRLRAFSRRDDDAVLVGELVVCDDPNAALPRPPGSARSLFEPSYRLEYFPDPDLLYFADANVTGTCEPARRLFRIAVADDDPRAAFIASHLFFNLAILELLKRSDRFPVHAAAVERDGGAVLIAGGSGAGKSTLVLACALAGFGYLGDDVAVLRLGADGDLAIDAFPDELDLRDDVLAHFPALGASLGHARISGKRSFSPLDVDGVRISWTATPRVLVFPSGTRSRPATLTPISTDDALARLVPNVLRTETQSAQRHLDALARLARGTRAFALAIADPSEAPLIFSSLLHEG